MPILNVQRLLSHPFAEVDHSYTARDTMLYALGLGLGADPLDPVDLRFVYEKDLMPLPTMPVVLGHPGHWGADPALGLDFARILHAGIDVELQRPLEAAATVRAREKVVALVDKGVEKGALMVVERRLVDAAGVRPLAVVLSTTLLRGNGGCGANVGTVSAPHPVPGRAAQAVAEIPTLARQALIYRLSGDYNPLHAEPAVAESAGFERPILHGLCTFGVSVASLIRQWCAGDARQLRRMAVRWTAPVWPGETLRVESWREGGRILFRGFVKERDVKVLDNGLVELF